MMARRAMTTTTRPRVMVWAAATGAVLAARSPPLRTWAVDEGRRLGARGGGGGGAETDFLGMGMGRKHISYIEIRSRDRIWMWM